MRKRAILLLVALAAIFTLPAAVTQINLASQVVGILPCGSHPVLTGDVTTSSGSCATNLSAGSVTNADLAAGAYRTVMHTFCTGGSMAASSTVFMPGYGGVLTTCTGLGTTRTSGTKLQAGTIKNLNVNLGTGGKSGDAVTVEVAGVASAVTCTYGTATSCSDTTHTAAVTAGQVVTVKVVTGASDTSANINVTFEFWN